MAAPEELLTTELVGVQGDTAAKVASPYGG